MPQRSVLLDQQPVSKADFRAAMLTGLARCSRDSAAKRHLADAMELTSVGLEDILQRSAMPGAKRLFDALSACPAVLDNVLSLYGYELVSKGESAAKAPATAAMAVLLAQIAAAESPDSPGGAEKTHVELMPMEGDLRTVNRITRSLLDEIDRFRTPRVVA